MSPAKGEKYEFPAKKDIIRLVMLSAPLKAACTTYISSRTINAGTITLQRDVITGSNISDLIRSPEKLMFSCQDTEGTGTVQAGIVSAFSK